MRTLFDKIFSYLLSFGLAGAILVLGLALIYADRGLNLGASGEGGSSEWPAPFELEAGALTAKAAVVYDPAEERVLYAKNADLPLPLASLTKLVAAEAVLAHNEPEQPVTITASSMSPEGDWGFWVGEEWPTSDLILFSLAASSNDAIAAAAESLGPDYIDQINIAAREAGLSSIQVFNPTGLDQSPEKAGGYGSAHDMARLTAAFMREYPTYFEVTATPYITISQGFRILTATSTAGPLLDIPGLRGAKTGYTELAGGNLVAAVDVELGRPLIIAVLGSTRDARFADVKTLLEAARRK